MNRPQPLRGAWLAAALIVAGLSLGACAPNQATGRSQFVTMSPAEEAKIGADEHPKVLEAFGGSYENPRVAAYVQRVGEQLARRSELPDLKFTFTVLNSDIYNAFALPGGYIYITRGLLALMGSEAELASVLGHEIGHVTARHTAERMAQSTAANIGATIFSIGVAILTGSNEAGNLAGQASGALAGTVLASYSREQEFEADKLGVRYMSLVGYNPDEAADMLAKLGEGSRLELQVAGRSPDEADQFSIMQTHPRTADRVREALAAARAQGLQAVANPRENVEEYYAAIDGMAVGGDAEAGFIRGRIFTHPKLRFRFEAPEKFRLVDGQDAVRATGPDGAQITFDMRRSRAPDPTSFLTNEWARGARLSNVERIDVNGLPAATGVTRLQGRSGAVDARLVAIRQADGTFFRLLFLAPPAVMTRNAEAFRRTTYSFRALTAQEAQAAGPLRIRLVRATAGDDFDALARRMAANDGFERERFRIINGLRQGEAPVAGRLYKIVAER
jgi:predicted Zn-dependent protease